MKVPKYGKILRIFIGESDKHKGQPLYDTIMHMARREGLAGCTVIRGLKGFGAASKIDTAKILRLSEERPIIIKIVDSEKKIDDFLPKLNDLIPEGLVTVERVQVVLYRYDIDKLIA
jgi:PII-like signaling protein